MSNKSDLKIHHTAKVLRASQTVHAATHVIASKAVTEGIDGLVDIDEVIQAVKDAMVRIGCDEDTFLYGTTYLLARIVALLLPDDDDDSEPSEDYCSAFQFIESLFISDLGQMN